MTSLDGTGRDLLVGQYSDDHSAISFIGDIYARTLKSSLGSSEQGCGDGPFVTEELPLKTGPILHLASKADYVYAEKNLAVVNEKKSVSLIINEMKDGVKSQLGKAIVLGDLSSLEGAVTSSICLPAGNINCKFSESRSVMHYCSSSQRMVSGLRWGPFLKQGMSILEVKFYGVFLRMEPSMQFLDHMMTKGVMGREA